MSNGGIQSMEGGLTPLKHFTKEDIELVNFVVNNKRCLLWVGMGAGKTIGTLTAVTKLLNSCEVSKVLVVAPLATANNTWGAEIEKWEHTKHLDYEVLTNKSKVKWTTPLTTPNKTSIHIINYEKLRKLVDIFKRHPFPYDMVIFDECTALKNMKALVTKSAYWVAAKASRVVLMTGTPYTNNNPLELWSQAYVLDRGATLGANISVFKKNFGGRSCEMYGRQKYTTIEWEPDSAERVVKALSPFMYVRSSARIVPIETEYVNVELSAKELELYKKVMRKRISPILNRPDMSLNASTIRNLLCQIAQGTCYNERIHVSRSMSSENYTIIHESKIKKLKTLVNSYLLQGENVIIAYKYLSDLDMIRNAFATVRTLKDNLDIVKLWNAGHIPILAMHPKSGGHGLNLQYGGNVLIWYGIPDSLEYYEQLTHRLARYGQRAPKVKQYVIVTKSTVDETIVTMLSKKHGAQTDVLATAALSRGKGVLSDNEVVSQYMKTIGNSYLDLTNVSTN